ncbi:adenylate/guanylate cyclase domain-containing protein [bacterium]|nr:adenylate/guanylate cyclase domain-containing protein [bacterium]
MFSLKFMFNLVRGISLPSIRFTLTGGVTLCILFTAGLIGGISIWGGLNSAIALTRLAQNKKTEQLSDKLTTFANSLHQEAATISEVIGLSANDMRDDEVINILSTYAKHKKELSSITLVRKDRTNVWVGHWKGEVSHEINTELDEESYTYAINGSPNDGGEGFEGIYIEPSEGRPVITYTKHFSDGTGKPTGTIYIDLGLKTLSQALSSTDKQNIESTFVFDKAGSVIAHPSLMDKDAYKKFDDVPHIKSTDDPIAIALYEQVNSGKQPLLNISTDQGQWLVSVAANYDIGNEPWFIASVIPRDAILGPAIGQAKTTTIIAILIITASVTCTQVVGRSISRSLDRLAKAADAVQKLDLEIDFPNQSIFDEVNRTEKAFRSMIGGLEVFAKYVPSGLVKRLMELQATGSTIKAEEREVTILFTDIIGYTSISDGMDPSELAVLLNEYFELLVSIVSRHGGTVDKFIGDALMVFWNAPDHQEDHADRAIQCALNIKAAIASYNKNRLKSNKKPLETRIGVHTGTVLAGEIGSSERMNYTIVGDSVNTAARLEALGKTVGQTLCISSSTKQQAAQNYSWLEIDRIVLRGRSSPTIVYTVNV